jgi:hypothetical protein
MMVPMTPVLAVPRPLGSPIFLIAMPIPAPLPRRLCLLLLLLAGARDARAQLETTAPSAATTDSIPTFVLRANAFYPVSIGRVGRYYEENRGWSVDAEGVFALGSVGVTLGWTSLLLRTPAAGVRVPDNPRLRAKVIGLNWRTPALSFKRMQARMGVRVATVRLSLPDTLVSRNDRTEDELALGLTAIGTVRLSSTLHFSMGGDVSRVFASTPWKLSTASAGLEWHHPMPHRVERWLR